MTSHQDETSGSGSVTPKSQLTAEVVNDPQGWKSRRARRRRRQLRNRWLTALGVVVVLVVAGVLLVPFLQSLNDARDEPVAVSTSRNPSPGLDGIIATGMRPEHFEPGDCLTDFVSADDPATVIECESPHQAQLVGRKTYPETASYAGSAPLRGDAEEFCASVQLTGSADAVMVIEISHPSEGSWAEGDRRVDCYVKADEGTLTSSLIDTPLVEEPADEETTETEEGTEESASPAETEEPANEETASTDE